MYCVHCNLEEGKWRKSITYSVKNLAVNFILEYQISSSEYTVVVANMWAVLAEISKVKKKIA